MVASKQSWGLHWRSSDIFIISTMSLALFTDELLFAFMVPLLPNILEHRIGVNPSLTQQYISIFLTEGAFASVVSSPLVGSIADAVSNKKTLLLILLAMTLFSIACLSLTTSLALLFVGHFFQAITSNALWIVGMASMAENIGSHHMGKITALASLLTATGTTSGPVLSGIFFQIGGYWAAWAAVATFLFADVVMRLLMVEKRAETGKMDPDHTRSPLLPDGSDHSAANDQDSHHFIAQEVTGWGFYICLFRQPRFTAGIFCYFVFALFIACFEATLVVHVRNVFAWDAFPTGLLLASIQGPGILLAPPVGWMKDRVGPRTPTAVGFFALVPCFIFLGIPGDGRYPWADDVAQGKIIYSICTATIGCLMCLLNGVGNMEATETVDMLQSRQPGIFGPSGGYSRVMAVTCMAWMAGLMTGPILSGLVVDNVGYFELQCILACTSFAAGCVALLFLRPSPLPHLELE